MNLFTNPQEVSKTNQDANPDGVSGTVGISGCPVGEIPDLGVAVDAKKDRKKKCCVCGEKWEPEPKENEKRICDTCLQKRKENGNPMPEEFVNKAFNCDAFDIIKRIPDSSINLILTDLPYGDNEAYGRLGKEILNNEDEKINYRFLDAIYPKMKDDSSIYMFTNHKFADKIRRYATEQCEHKYVYNMQCILVKSNIGLGYNWRNQYEICLVFDKKNPVYFLNNMSNTWFSEHVRHDESNLKHISKTETHPHQKDINVLRKIIRHSSRENELVGDFFLGSGAVAVASIREGRRWIGSELDKKWFSLCEKSIQAEQSKISMF